MPALTQGAIKEPPPDELLAPEERVRWDLIVAAIAFGVVIIDQIVKRLVVDHFHSCTTGDFAQVIGNVITFQYVCNRGTAFSLFEGSGVVYFLIAVAIGVIAWLYLTVRPRQQPWLKLTFGAIIGGAIGNIIDRVRLGFVVDFIHFQIPGHFDFAFFFNVADSCIVVGMGLLAVIFWTLPREADPALDMPAIGSDAVSSRSAARTTTDATTTSTARATQGVAKTPPDGFTITPGAIAKPAPTKAGTAPRLSGPISASRSAKYPNTVKSKRKKR